MRPTTSLPASVVCTAFKPFERNTLRGFADFQLTAAGVTIRSFTVHEQNGKRWIPNDRIGGLHK